MIKRKPNIMKFTADELAAIKSIAECECAYTNTFRACFKNECEGILKELDNDNGGKRL